ncbi:MAG: hypothetical protein BGO38_09685 [Cellulomonas sp. 73-145]|uniref:ABC transporter permease n=1 Tax=Cellulomonas sp. 73-145 TaxID=1895739 RepID=UPI00092BF1D3|nr:ABC transporter permease [Cellulomonas sp. 73-145]OJV60974.1 MAG: hypothetical protein BGO38_09685 [Cellulomonas sp. 73-145]
MTPILVRRFLLDHARNRTTAVVLVLVPVAFVLVAAPTLADAARLLGGRGGGPAVEVATAGWAAAFVTGMAMYLQVTDSREADRRLVLAGAKAVKLAAARVLVGLVLAAVSAAAALGALVLRVRVDQPLRVALGAFLAAVAYLVVGAVVGTLVRVPVNGAVLILFIWIVDVFFGPNLSGTATPALRLMPLHYVSLWTTRVASGHAGRAGDLGLALGWAAGSLLVTAMVIALGARPHRRRTGTSRPGSARDQLGAALGVGWRELRRNPVLWVLLALVPAVFVLLSAAITPSGATPVAVVEHGVRLTQVFDPAKIHAGTMAPIAVASLAALVGVFLSVDSGPADRRLVLAGLRPGALAGARGLVVAAAALGVTAVTAGVTATVFDAQQWPAYVLANTLLALIYAALGALAAPLLGRVTGVFVAFLGPFLDVGLAQSPMLRAEPAQWARVLPGYGPVRMVVDAGLTGSFDATAELLLTVAWVLALGAVSAVAMRHQLRSRARVNFITS